MTSASTTPSWIRHLFQRLDLILGELRGIRRLLQRLVPLWRSTGTTSDAGNDDDQHRSAEATPGRRTSA